MRKLNTKFSSRSNDLGAPVLPFMLTRAHAMLARGRKATSAKIEMLYVLIKSSKDIQV